MNNRSREAAKGNYLLAATLSPLTGLFVMAHFSPRLTPWASLFRHAVADSLRSRRRKEADFLCQRIAPPRHLGGYRADAARMPRNRHPRMRALHAVVSRPSLFRAVFAQQIDN